jgi:hypothetical protein
MSQSKIPISPALGDSRYQPLCFVASPSARRETVATIKPPLVAEPVLYIPIAGIDARANGAIMTPDLRGVRPCAGSNPVLGLKPQAEPVVHPQVAVPPAHDRHGTTVCTSCPRTPA